MLKQFYVITKREKPISDNLEERVRTLLDDYHMPEEVVRSSLVANRVNLYELNQAFNMYSNGKKWVRKNGNGAPRNIYRSIYAPYIPAIQDFLRTHNNDYHAALKAFPNVGQSFLYQVANEMGIDTRGSNPSPRGLFNPIIMEIVTELQKGREARDVYEEFASTGISLKYIRDLRSKYAKEFLRKHVVTPRKIKEEILRRLKNGESVENLAEEYNIPRHSIIEWRRIYARHYNE